MNLGGRHNSVHNTPQFLLALELILTYSKIVSQVKFPEKHTLIQRLACSLFIKECFEDQQPVGGKGRERKGRR